MNTTIQDPKGSIMAPVQPLSNQSGNALPMLLQYWNILFRHRVIIAIIVIICVAAGLIITLMSTPKYNATTRIEISRQQNNVTNVEGVKSEEEGRDVEFYFTQYSLLEARSLAERVVRRLNLARDDAFFEAVGVDIETGILGSDVGKASSIASAELAERQRLAVQALLDGVTISPIRGSSLIDVTFTSASPNLSARVANAWVAEFIQQSLDRRFASTSDARKFLQTRLDDLRQRLEISERDVVNYAANQGIIRIESGEGNQQQANSSNQTLTLKRLQALDAELATAVADRVTAEGRLDALRSRGASDEALQNPAINRLRERRAELAAEYARLLVQFEPAYPAALALREQISTLEANISREEKRVLDVYKTSFDAAQAREASMKAKLERELARFDTEQRSGIQLSIFRREADTNRQLYDGLLQRFKEIGVAGVGANNISIVDAAIVPIKPSSPRLGVNLLVALALGVVLALSAAFILENLDEGVREPDQIGPKLNVPLLGVIPVVDNGLVRDQVNDSKSHVYEAYQSVRTNLAFSTDHGVPRTLMVTSTQPSEGKSTSSYAIATVLSRSGLSVLIVDIDLRKPVLHKNMELENRAGVSDFLAGSSDLDSLLQDSGRPNLSFLSAGPTPPNAAELLSGPRLRLMVNALSEKFDHIVFDSPPMLGLADAPLIASNVEGIVYVVEAKRTAARGVLNSLARLREAKTRIFGVVLTKYRSTQFGYDYGYGYGYGYGADGIGPSESGSEKT